MIFKSKKITNSNNVGQILKNARYKTGLSLKMVAKHIKINKKYLTALENDDWKKLPGKIYAKKFFQKYCEFLEIDLNKINLNFNKIYYFKNTTYKENFTKKTKKSDFFNTPKTIKFFLFILIISIVLFYLIWQINDIIKPPTITIFHPIVNLTTHKNKIIISGQTEKGVELKINNETIFLDSKNKFSQSLSLQPGLNSIKIIGQKKYSKKQIIERKIIVE